MMIGGFITRRYQGPFASDLFVKGMLRFDGLLLFIICSPLKEHPILSGMCEWFNWLESGDFI